MLTPTPGLSFRRTMRHSTRSASPTQTTPQEGNDKGAVWVFAGGGRVHGYDSTDNWNSTKVILNADATLHATKLNSGNTSGSTIGSSGAVLNLLGGSYASIWEQEVFATNRRESLRGGIAVGPAGAIIEREEEEQVAFCKMQTLDFNLQYACLPYPDQV